MRRSIKVVLLCGTLMAASVAASPDDLLEKINRLEQQIQELKALKEQQKLVAEKEDQCMKAVGRDKFCKCLLKAYPATFPLSSMFTRLLPPKAYLNMTP